MCAGKITALKFNVCLREGVVFVKRGADNNDVLRKV